MSSFVDGLRARVDEVLRRFLDGQREVTPAARPLIDEISRLLSAGGKRLRPAFCYWGHRAAAGADGREIVNAAASLELFHTFAIVHDDIMDASALRRGVPATHVALGPGATGVANAILAGDLAFVLADRLLLESGFDANRVAAAFAWYTRMRLEVVAGQHADVMASRRGADEPAARRIAALKSGSYTVEKPLAIGAALAGADDPVIQRLAAFGRPLGEAFQLRDDVLGAFGRPAVTGKDADSDLREGKATVLVAKARRMAAPADRAFLEARLGAPDLSSGEADRLRSVIRDSGALDATVSLIEDLRSEALAVLARSGFDGEVGGALTELAELATSRDA